MKIQFNFPVECEFAENELAPILDNALKKNPDFILVTRCEKCKYFTPYGNDFHIGYCCFEECQRETEKDNFCKYGERGKDE